MKKVIILFILISFISCEKDNEQPQIIYPGSYYPCYPNSWWVYQVNDTAQQTWTVSSNYEPHSYKIGYDSDYTYTDIALVPFLNGNPIYGYNYIEHIPSSFGDYYVKWPILREEIGYQFQRAWRDPRYGDYSEKVEVTGKSFDGTDSLLILEGHWVWGSNTDKRTYQVYKKDIGLTHHYKIDLNNNDTLDKKILINYFIGN